MQTKEWLCKINVKINKMKKMRIKIYKLNIWMFLKKNKNAIM